MVRGVALSVLERNPFITNPSAGDPAGDREDGQPPSTKLIIGNIPLSFADSELIQAVKAMGVTSLSKLVAERDRDSDGKLTHWKTGRRFIFIAVPPTPLPRSTTIGPFRASLYHKEQKTADRQREAECRKCLAKGHRAADCTAPIKCRQCLKDGHKAGDPLCPRPASTPADACSTVEEENPAPTSRPQRPTREESGRSDSEDRPERTGRPRTKAKQKQQTKLTVFRRDSSSAKRRRSPELLPPPVDKQRRLQTRSEDDTDGDDSLPPSGQDVWG